MNPKPNPPDGGSYRRNPDGSLTQLSPTTGERPCKCRPESIAGDDPAAPVAPAIEQTDTPVVVTEERTAEPGTAAPPIDPEPTRRAKRKE